ncbi:MAG: VWA domain-containing protein [Mesorhizobium sp.]
MTALLRNLLGVLILLTTASVATAAERVIVILDASGSMWGQIDGKPKQEIARQSLRSALASVPAGEEIGFMAYGHREKASCDDVELIVPPATGTANAISTAADNLKFLGKTPLTAAVRQAAEALNYTEGQTKIVLITDGLESCGGDPCALGKELKAAGPGFTADIVGFGLSSDDGRQVACLAEATGGKYIQASDEKALQEALAEAVATAPAAQETAPAEVTKPAATEPSPEPATEPSPGPAAEPSPEPAAEPSPDPVTEPSSEPAAETSPGSVEKPASPAGSTTQE